MSVQEQIAKLESLLATVQRNKGRPRIAAPVASSPPAAGSPAPARAPAVADSTPPPLVLTGAPPTASKAPIEDLEVLDDDIVELPPEDIAVASTGSAAAAVASNGAQPSEKAPPRQPAPRTPVAVEAELEGADAIDELLEADLSGAPISLPSSEGQPTMSQLGETVELEGADAPRTDLELAVHGESESPAASQDDMEVSLPRGGTFAGGYDATLEPPPEARDELAQHQRAQESGVVNVKPGAEVRRLTGPTGITERTTLPSHGEVSEVLPMAPGRTGPTTFLELLDASLRLGE